MASDVQIAKLALNHIGDRWDIAALTEASVEAEQVNLIYADVRDTMLRAHPWGFAKKFTSPATLSGTVPGGWDYMYQYPTDAVRVLGVTDPFGVDTVIKFEIATNSVDQRVILTDQNEAEFYYTSRVTDPTRFDPEFTMAFSYALAAMLAMPLTGDGGIASAMEQKAFSTGHAAFETDSSEGFSKEAPDADWITARL